MGNKPRKISNKLGIITDEDLAISKQKSKESVMLANIQEKIKDLVKVVIDSKTYILVTKKQLEQQGEELIIKNFIERTEASRKLTSKPTFKPKV